MTLLLLAVMSLAGSPQDRPASPSDVGQGYFDRLIRDRDAITSGYLEYVVVRDVDGRDKDLEGSSRTYKLWFDRNRKRLDLQETRPNDPSQSMTARYSYDGVAHRIIDVDRSNFEVREYTAAYLKGQQPPGALLLTGHLIDPRLIGLIGMEFGFLQYHGLDEFRTIARESQIESTGIAGTDAPTMRINTIYPDGSGIAYFIPERATLPSKVVTKFVKQTAGGKVLPDIRVEVESELTSWPNEKGQRFEFPRLVKIRRFSDGVVEDEETIMVRVANFNIPLNSTDFGWQALRPARGALFSYNGQSSWSPTRSIRWNGEKFATVINRSPEASFEINPASTVPSGITLRVASLIVLSLATLLAGAVVALKLLRRGRSIA